MNNLFSMPKMKSPQIAKMRFARKGERTLTKADKKKELKNSKHKCQKCKKSFPAYQLDVHHKKGVASYKSQGIADISYIEFYIKRKKKAHYDRSKNLRVLCKNCHAKVHQEERENKKSKKKTSKRKRNNPLDFKW